jgi:hypothetical protein
MMTGAPFTWRGSASNQLTKGAVMTNKSSSIASAVVKGVTSAVVAGALIAGLSAGLSGRVHAAAAGANPGVAPEDGAIRPFTVHVPQAALDDLRRRIAATRWPDRETVTDRSQGVQLEKLQALLRYWGTDYDWRKAESKLNALPQFMTTIDGVDVYFIHVRSRQANALPLIMTHGWPGSVFELLKTITDERRRAG